MGVSRLDSIPLATNITANTGAQSGSPIVGETPYFGPINGIVTFYGFGTLGGGTWTVEVTPDGVNWFQAFAGATGDGPVLWQGAAIGARCKLISATNPNWSCRVVVADFS